MTQPVMDREKANQCLEDLRSLASGLKVFHLANAVLNNREFAFWSGSHQTNMHHYGDHGLVQHTHEVVTSCLHMRKFYPQYDIDERELYLAALFHDYGKLYDYDFEMIEGKRIWSTTLHKRRVYHLPRSAIFWETSLDKYEEKASDKETDLMKAGKDVYRPSFEKYRDNVLHAILAHHQQRDWGSPVPPDTRVAWMLHLCDSISARLYDVDTLKR